ncbi:MAG: TIGR03618 family F420-dependent PPOX class oxidoreductase [Frankiaceae bacterium]
MDIPKSVRQVLAGPALGHFVTLNADGSPQVTCVWVGLAGDELVVGSLGVFQKIKNIRSDPRVAISFETDESNEIGMRHSLVVYGTARVESGGAPQLLQRLARTYVGPDVRFPPMPDPPPGYVIRVTPSRFTGLGPWQSE